MDVFCQTWVQRSCNKVEMNPDGKGWIKLKSGGKITIYLRNGVWKLPVWIWDPFSKAGQVKGSVRPNGKGKTNGR